MAKKKTKFDWSILDRHGLINFLWMISGEIIDKNLTIDQFHSTLKKHMKKYMPLRVAKQFDDKIDLGHPYMGGTYYSYFDEPRRKCIEVVLSYNPKTKRINLSDRKFRRVCVNFADTVLHEIIHMRQFRRRNFKVLPEYASNAEKTEQRIEQNYLGSTDEIDAYGFNIACELLDRFENNHKKAIKYLNQHLDGRSRNGAWKMYLKAFDYDHDHPIIKRVKKKVIRYLPYAESGKPYKNKDWIDH